MHQLIFVNRYFFPDHSATSQILSDLAFHLAGTGRRVHVVTSRQHYEDAKAELPREEVVNGVQVHRVASSRFGRRSLVGRSVDYLSFYRSVRRRLLDMARAGDIVIAKTDPPLLAVVAMPAAHRRGAHVINWLQDIYPETAMVLGVPLMRGPAAAVSAAWRDRSLRRAAATVVVGDLMARKVEALGAPPARVHVIANWCNDEDIRPLAGARNPLREAWGLDGKFVLGYSGNLGRAHEFDTVLAAAEALRHDSRIVFLMIGGGKRFDDLAGIVRQRRLDGAFRFMPYQPRELLPYSLAAADLHWLSLNPALEGLIVPSKFYGIAAAGKPMIVIAAQDGELARLVQQFDCGIVIAPGDAAALVGTVLRLSTDDRALARMGMCARHMLEERFTRQRAFAQWVELFDRIEASVAPDERSAPTLADRPD